jgi:uncharacterized RDD family membrane protein YckC
MRCPKCQYLGFEPSPRCKNCGYDFSFGSDDLPGLTIVPDADEAGAIGDFDLQMPDEPSRHASSVPAGGFDLDALLEHGRTSVDPAPGAVMPSAVSDLALEMAPRRSATASAVATPQPEDVLRIVDVEAETVVARVAEPAVVLTPSLAPKPAPEPVAIPRVAAAPATTELPLFMQSRSEVVMEAPAPKLKTPAPVLASVTSPPRVPAGMPETVEAATAIIETPVVEEIDDRPLVQVPATPRAPLAVRRATPDPARMRAKYAKAANRHAASADGDLLRGIDDLESNLSASRTVPADRLSAEPTPESLPAGWLQGVSAGKRVSAAALDVLLMGILNTAVVWFTLSVCGLSASQANLLPLVPIALFFVLLDGGYLVLFTAACGQTIGKMAAGIRVVGTSTGAVINDRLSLGQSVARSLGALLSCLPLGVGLWMSLVGDGRALHDRIAHTRVVRA